MNIPLDLDKLRKDLISLKHAGMSFQEALLVVVLSDPDLRKALLEAWRRG